MAAHKRTIVKAIYTELLENRGEIFTISRSDRVINLINGRDKHDNASAIGVNKATPSSSFNKGRFTARGWRAANASLCRLAFERRENQNT